MLWQPGTDHAGVATEIVVAGQLSDEEQDETPNWAAPLHRAACGYGRRQSAAQSPASCGASAPRRTGADRGGSQMDPARRRRAPGVCDALLARRLVYRDKRLVNWDPEMHTVISDLEVDNRETQARCGTSATRSRNFPAAS